MPHDWAGLIKAIEAIPEQIGVAKIKVRYPDKTYFERRKPKAEHDDASE